MSKLRVNAFTVSADGFGAGPDQGRDQPLGRGGDQLHRWFLPTRTFQENVLRRDGGTTGVDNIHRGAALAMRACADEL